MIGRLKLDQAFNRSATYYAKHGEAGLMEFIRAELAQSAADVRKLADARAQAGGGGEVMADRLPPARSAPRRPYVFLAPYLLVSAVFFVVPLINAVTLAFYKTNGPRSRVFVGLDNFRFLFHDTVFLTALWNTTVYALVSVFVQLPLAMGLALLLNRGSPRLRGLLPAGAVLAQPGRADLRRRSCSACCSRPATA